MRKKLSTTLFSALILVGSATLLASCNTVAGAGKDVSSAGHAVTNTADDAKK